MNIRILQHDTEDRIRIGVAYHYRRVALVDRQTLEVLRLIHPAD